MQKGMVLIVDDEEQVRSVLMEYLVSLGYGVETAESGEDALKKFIPGHHECVVSDLFMPTVGGLELLKLLRKRDPKLLFLMITGYPSIESAVEAMKEGAYDYLTKPFKIDDIKIKLERAYQRRNLENSLKKVNGIMWGLIFSIPVWLILGIILGFVWKM